jgi:protein phosphatase
MLRYAARSDVGLLREGNEDSGYASPRLIAVADGMGGHAAGEVASSVAIATLAELDAEAGGVDPLVERLADAVRAANAHLRDMVAGDPELGGMGTTLTALLSDGSRFGLVHIGDSRGYLLRDGALQQITRDHTFVQTLIDEGRISEADADHHPQRSLILRALDGRDEVEPDLSIREARVGDRYLICSDGLSGVVSEQTISETLAAADSPEQAVDELVDLALRGGGPDNITAIVADVVDGQPKPSAALKIGAAADEAAGPAPTDFPAAKAAALTSDEDGEEPGALGEERRGRGGRLLLLVLLVLILGGGYGAWAWSQEQYYVGADGQRVAIFRGLPDDIGPVTTSRVHKREDIPLKDLPGYQRQRVRAHITAADFAHAQRIVDTLREQAALCQEATADPSPGSTPSEFPSAVATPSPSPQSENVPPGCGPQAEVP